MAQIGTLILGDNNCTLYDGRGFVVASAGVQELVQAAPSNLHIYLNIADIDVSRIQIPPMGFWDRRRFSNQRQQNQKLSLLIGTKFFNDCLIEVSCPRTPTIQQLIQDLVKLGKRVLCLKPLLLPMVDPQGLNDEMITLVVSDHGLNGYRQTAYINGKPFFTRVSANGLLADEALSTLSYLKNQFHFKKCLIQCHLKPSDFDLLASMSSDEVELKSIPLAEDQNADELVLKACYLPYNFVLPPALQEPIFQHRSKVLNQTTSITATLLFILSGWQYYDYSKTLELQENTALSSTSLDTQVNLVKASLPLEKLLPDHYKAGLNETSPVAIFQSINQAFTNDIRLSAVKWENSPVEERILMEVKIVGHENDADQNLDVIQDFQANLQEALPDFEAEMQSLPYGSAEQETFSGTAAGQELTLAGDKSKARIQLIRKKPL